MNQTDILDEKARDIIADCHKSAPEVLQWEEKIVYLALKEDTVALEAEARRGIRSIRSFRRLPLANWITEMWLRLPPAATGTASATR